ncbi:MAG: zinc ribbon domain-containing protein [Promethearchaeota archaeon]
MEVRNKVLFFVSLVCAVLIFLSQNFFAQGTMVQDFFDWLTYDSISGTVYVSFQDSYVGQMIPVLGYFPAIAGALVIIGSFILFKTVIGAKILSLIGGIIAILAFVFFTIFHIIFEMINYQSFIPNLPGAYFCLVSGIMGVIMAFLLKIAPEMGYVKEDKEYYAIGTGPASPVTPDIREPRIRCPNCGTIASGDQLFCEQCGQYF